MNRSLCLRFLGSFVAIMSACGTDYVSGPTLDVSSSNPSDGGDGSSLTPPDARSDHESASPSRLLQLTDLTYVGAFRVPDGTIGGSAFDFGGTAMAYNATNKSLFVVGHDWQQMVAEVKIPDIRMANRISDLATATVIQTFVDPTAGKLKTVGEETKVGGLLVDGNRMLGTAFVYYDAAKAQKFSHFTTSLKLSDTASFKGMYTVGALGAGYVSGYMAHVPKEWQAPLGGRTLTGQCCIPIISRTSFGPSAFAFEPNDLGATTPVPTVPLLYYTEEHATLGAWGAQSKTFNGTSSAAGMVFPSGTRSLLYIGAHGVGPWCYGVGGASGECYDPANTYKGNHAYPYVHQIWAYDVEDLAKVRSGAKQPWQLVPYGVWNFDLPFQTELRRIAGVTYDDNSRRIYLSEHAADGDRPLIHVFDVK